MELKKLFKKLQINQKPNEIVAQAFYHSSYFYENKEIMGSNERLEFIGDAVLELWTSKRLFENCDLDEGKMTIERAQFVCEKSFAAFSREFGLNEYIKLGIGEEKSGGRNKDSILADLFEAFIGALDVSYGEKFVFNFLDRILGDRIATLKLDKGAKNELQEYVQGDKRNALNYEVTENSGPANNRTFKVTVYLNDIALGFGVGKTKKMAEQLAAEDALGKLVK